MKRLLSFLFFIFSIISFAQEQVELKGTVKDESTGETIIGASVLYEEGKGVVWGGLIPRPSMKASDTVDNF